MNIIILGLIGICLKILLIPAYFSTDFDVHHNWLRITYEKPLSEWYYDNQSKWTLDYPPFFAYFEYFLAFIGSFVDNNLFILQTTKSVIYYQRLTVIITQIPFLYILYLIFNKKVSFSLVFSYLFIPFIILDNIHFQYNIFLQTIFLTSLYFLLKKQNYLIAALTYSILLNFKHIYIYCGLAYFLIILKNYVFKEQNQKNKQYSKHNQKYQQIIKRFIKVAIITIIPFVISFGPFITVGGIQYMKQILSRLFPFGRGLIHDYWAPNFWALYYMADKVLSFVIKKIFPFYNKELLNVGTLNQVSVNQPLNSLKLLYEPSANLTILIILIFLIPTIFYVYKNSKINNLKLILVNGLIFFMFGYHVHQKAITPYLHLFYVFIMANSSENKEQSLRNVEKNNQIQLKRQYGEKQQQKQELIQQNLRKQQMNENNIIETHYQNYQYSNYEQIKQICSLIFINIINLFPLLINPPQRLFKILLTLLYYIITINCSFYYKNNLSTSNLINFSSLTLKSSLILSLLTQIILPFMNIMNKNKMQFLPLMINSVTCACFNILWLGKVYYKMIKGNN